MSDLEGLTPEQAEKVLQFQHLLQCATYAISSLFSMCGGKEMPFNKNVKDLTGVEEFPMCIDILCQYDWDLDLAVNETVTTSEESGAEISASSPESAEVNNIPVWLQTLQSINSLGVRGLFRYVVYLFLKITYNTILSLWQYTFGLLRPDPRRFVTDPVGDVVSFIDTYEEKYGNTHPTFYRGSYSQALNEAKQELRFLLVYLHCEDHQDTSKFCKETLPHQDVIEYIDTSMLFWACSVTTPEGYRVSQALRENGYPFLAMIALVDGRMMVVGRLEGALKPADLIYQLSNLVRDNEGALAAARAERYQRSFNQTLRQQQDEAYLESLRADQEKERKRREEQERKENEVLRQQQHQLEAELRKQCIARQKVEFTSRIPEEPAGDHPESVHIVFKLPNGTRLERRFLQSHSLKDLYYYVFCNPASPNSFEITTNFPKRVLKCQEDEDSERIQTLGEAGLRCKEVLFVHDLEA